jgi:hypothetical protein
MLLSQGNNNDTCGQKALYTNNSNNTTNLTRRKMNSKIKCLKQDKSNKKTEDGAI